MFAMDSKWWREYGPECTFKGERYSMVAEAWPDVQPMPEYITDIGNSGIGAMLLAKHFGARRIVLMGYDCKPAPDGKRHWHGSHTRRREKLTDAGSLDKWPAQFGRIARRFDSIDVVNASRDTALTVWPRVTLEDALC
jgi:hypothetical protein